MPINFAECPQIEVLKIDKCKNLSLWLMKFLEQPNLKLKMLKIFKSRLCDDERDIIEGFIGDKIANLAIIKCENISGSDLDEDVDYFDDECSIGLHDEDVNDRSDSEFEDSGDDEYADEENRVSDLELRDHRQIIDLIIRRHSPDE